MEFDRAICENIERAEPARLIPVATDGAKELRAVSILLANFAAVGEFGRTVLRRAGAPSGKTARIRCFTEASFKAADGAPKPRPDGLIVVTQGAQKWICLVEVKIGRAPLEASQIETYLDLARDNQFDAILTISNQFGGGPTGHPASVDLKKTKKVSLVHLPWQAIVADAVLLCERDEVADSERTFLLREMIRYFTHENSGVVGFAQMNQSWKDLCFAFQQGSSLSKDFQPVKDAVGDWFDLSYFLSIELGLAIGHSVGLHLPREHAQVPARRFDDAAVKLLKEGRLVSEFAIPDAASRLVLAADMKRRTLTASMVVKAPGDRSFAKASMTWILRQLEGSTNQDILIRARWPGHQQDTDATLEKLRSNKAALLPPDCDETPTAFEVMLSNDLGAKFKSSRNFVEQARELALAFYGTVGQNLRAWVPAPPKLPNGQSDAAEKSAPQKTAETRSSESATSIRSVPVSPDSALEIPVPVVEPDEPS